MFRFLSVESDYNRMNVMFSLCFGWWVDTSCVFDCKKVVGVIFERAFLDSFLKVDMDVLDVHITWKKSRRDRN